MAPAHGLLSILLARAPRAGAELHDPRAIAGQLLTASRQPIKETRGDEPSKSHPHSDVADSLIYILCELWPAQEREERRERNRRYGHHEARRTTGNFSLADVSSVYRRALSQRPKRQPPDPDDPHLGLDFGECLTD